LKVRRGIDSTVIPNVFDFASPIPEIDDYNKDFRSALGLREDELFILQPTQILPRKGIEISVDLVHRLKPGQGRLFITHRPEEDEGISYWHWLKREAGLFGVEVILIDHLIGATRAKIDHHKIYSFQDAYLHADLVTYPSLYEGFGNALLETVYFKRPAVVNRYPVYNADIRPLGFDFIELDGFINEDKADQVSQLLEDPDRIRQMTEKNFSIAEEHFSFEVLEKQLSALIASFS
jgi:glycosyltransferase involved in cell wall biosynthesis